MQNQTPLGATTYKERPWPNYCILRETGTETSTNNELWTQVAQNEIPSTKERQLYKIMLTTSQQPIMQLLNNPPAPRFQSTTEWGRGSTPPPPPSCQGWAWAASGPSSPPASSSSGSRASRLSRTGRRGHLGILWGEWRVEEDGKDEDCEVRISLTKD